MNNFALAEEALGYQTSTDPSSIDKRFLIAGSKNVLIDYQNKVKIRSGYTRLGASSSATTACRNGWRWETSTGFKAFLRFYDDELEIYLKTVDGYAVNAWTRVKNSWSTTEKMRAATWFDANENIDLFLMIIGDDNIYEWNGAVAIANAGLTESIAEAGDASNQMSAWTFTGESSSNTNSYVLYWKLENSGTTRTVSIYKDSAGANLVAQGSRDGDGEVTLTQQNSSGLAGTVTVAYTADDTTISANTLTFTYTLTKKSTTTWAQNRFYAIGDKTFINVRTGEEFTYTGGESTTTLTGITPATSTDIVINDILIQKVVTNADKPAANHNNDIIYCFQNQIVIGSNDDEEVYISKNNDFTNFTFSSPRVAGEGALLTLTDAAKAVGTINKILTIFAGNSTAFTVKFEQIAIGSTLAETVQVEPIFLGENQGALCQEAVLEIGDAFAYLSNEVALRIISDPAELKGLSPKTLSNPIKPDFDVEDWYNGAIADAYLCWYKNMLLISAPQASHVYILNFVETADGNLKRYWNPPQILPVAKMVAFDLGDGKGELLYGFSNLSPEVNQLFDGQSDGQYSDMATEDKLPIDAKAIFAYDNAKRPANLKSFDEYYIKGEITPNTKDLICSLNYDTDGYTQKIEKTIDGSNETILEGSVAFNSLAQQSLAVNPLGGLLNPPSDARKFSTILEIAKEDYFELSATFSTNEIDRYWAILAHGSNAKLSNKKPINKKI